MLKVSLATGLSTGVVIGLVRGVDRALIPIGEPNLKNRSDRRENLSSLSITPHSCMELM